jgi:anti-sigma factor RsiW
MRPHCTDFEQDLVLLVGGELEPDQVARVEEHVGSCEACARLRARLERSQALLATAPIPRISSDEIKMMALRARASGGFQLRRRFLAAAAVLLALVVPAVTYFTFQRSESGPRGCDTIATAFDVEEGP